MLQRDSRIPKKILLKIISVWVVMKNKGGFDRVRAMSSKMLPHVDLITVALDVHVGEP